MLPKRILVICLRRLGDVLLATPLIHSLRLAYPDAVVDAVVFASTAGALEGNPDLDRIITWPQTTGIEIIRLLPPRFRTHDLAVAATASDRAQFLATWAAPQRLAMVQSGHAKPWALQRSLTHVPDWPHTVVQMLRLTTLLGIPAIPRVVPPRPANIDRLDRLLGPDWRARTLAVVHPAPMFNYKGWTHEGWRALIRWLSAQGLQVIVSGGPADTERSYVAEVLGGLDLADGAVCNLAGQLRFAELTPLIESARIFIGPDTSVTHLAAACSTPTIALFGPSSPVAWGPWPQAWAGTADSPWIARAPLQRVGNVCIVQGTFERFPGCIPCLREGCERHVQSVSDCLDQLSPVRVIAAADQMLGIRAPE